VIISNQSTCLSVTWWSTEHIRTRPRRLRWRRQYKKKRNVLTFRSNERTERRSCWVNGEGWGVSQKKMQKHELFREIKQTGFQLF